MRRASPTSSPADLIEREASPEPAAPVSDITRDAPSFPSPRDARLQTLARGDEGFLLGLAYSTQRGYGRTHPFVGEIRFGEAEVEFFVEDLGFAVPLGEVSLTECQMVNQFAGRAGRPPRFTRGYGLAFGQSERKAMAMALVDRALRADEFAEERNGSAQDEEFVLSHCDNVQATGFVEHLKLPHYVDFQAELSLLRQLRREREARADAVTRARGPNERAPVQLRLSRRTDEADDPPRDPQGRRDSGLSGSLRFPRNADALRLGHRRRSGDGRDSRTERCAQGDRPGRGRHDQRGLDPRVLRQDRRRRHDDGHGKRDHHPDAPPRARGPADRESNPRLPGADSGTAAVPRAARDGDAHHARARRIRRHAGQALRGHRSPRPYCNDLRLSGARRRTLRRRSLADPKIRQPEARRLPGAPALRSGSREAHLCDPALHAGRIARLRGPSVRADQVRLRLRVLRRDRFVPRRSRHRRFRRAHVRLLRHRLLREAAGGPGSGRQAERRAMNGPLLVAEGLSKRYGAIAACRAISFDIEEGEAHAIVGESGSGKTILLHLISGLLTPDAGVVRYRTRDGLMRDLATLSESERQALMRTDWGFVHQDAALGLRMNVSAGGNIGERLMALGDRHYGRIRETAAHWLGRVEIAADRLDHKPSTYSGGMRQRLQIARNLVTSPRLVFMDEPTGGLDVSVQARLLDLIRGLIAEMGLT